MRTTFKVSVDDINAELEKFSSAIESFRPYTQDFIQNTAERLSGFNSDFIDQMERLLENMTDTKAPELLKKAESLHMAAKQAMAGFVQVDQTITTKVSQGD